MSVSYTRHPSASHLAKALTLLDDTRLPVPAHAVKREHQRQRKRQRQRLPAPEEGPLARSHRSAYDPGSVCQRAIANSTVLARYSRRRHMPQNPCYSLGGKLLFLCAISFPSLGKYFTRKLRTRLQRGAHGLLRRYRAVPDR